MAETHPMAFEKENAEGKMEMWLRIPVTKASTKGKEEYVEMNVSAIDGATYIEFLYQGAKKQVNSGNTDIPGDKSPKSKELAKAKAQEQVQKVYENKVRITGGRGKSGEAQDVMVLARRKAVNILKAHAKRKGTKVSMVNASTWTKLGAKFLEGEQGALVIAEARAEIEAANTLEIKGIDLSELKEDGKLVEAAEKRKKERKKASKDIEEELLAGVTEVKRPTARPEARH
jgi:hypothetical protein